MTTGAKCLCAVLIGLSPIIAWTFTKAYGIYLDGVAETGDWIWFLRL